MGEWRETTLGQLVDITVGLPFASAEFSSDLVDVRLLRGDNIAQGALRWERAARWPRDRQVDPRYRVREGDVVLAMDRPWIEAGLKFAMVRSTDLPSYLVQRVALLRAKPGTDQRYIGHVIGSRAFTDYVLGIQTGSAVPHISGSQIANFRLVPHPPREQAAIADVLGALDDKIAANARLETLADEYVASLFSAAIAGTGTRHVPILSTLDVQFGEPFSGESFTEPGSGRPLIRIRDLRTFHPQVWTTETRPRETQVRPGDVLVGMDAEFRPTTWLGPAGVMNQRVLRASCRAVGPAFVREALKEPLAAIEGYKTGTTVIHLNKADLERHTVGMPGPGDLARFEALAEPTYAHRVTLGAERAALAATRDALLPALMSGALRVRDAERAVSDLT